MVTHNRGRRPIYNFAIDADLLAGIRLIKQFYGIPESEQIRRGLRLWLRSMKVKVIGSSMPPKARARALRRLINSRARPGKPRRPTRRKK